MLRVSINATKFTGKWPRIEKYQNSTLRYPAPADFPEYLEKVNGRPKIMRCWITLDEVWDYRTDEYFWDYRIGVNRYENDANHYKYDWPYTVPSQMHYKDCLSSHARHCEEVMLNIRRYERETADGIVSLDKYEEVVQNVIEYYKNLCPNIHYIEVSNESELEEFGNITVAQYYELYKRVYRAVGRLNKKYGYETPLKVGGSAMTDPMDRPQLLHQFLKHLADDTVPRKMLDFYSVHDYNRNISRLSAFYSMHHAWIKELNLPDLPIFFDEYGTVGVTSIYSKSLENAAGTLSGMILGAELKGMYIFPWCTYHNPDMQMSYTQFLQTEDSTYVPTPNGNAMTMLSMLKENRLEIKGNHQNRVAATGDGNSMALLVTNPTDKPLTVDLILEELPFEKVVITQYLVDSINNNCLTGPKTSKLHLTDRWNERVKKEDRTVEITTVLDKYAFSLWVVEPFR